MNLSGKLLSAKHLEDISFAGLHELSLSTGSPGIRKKIKYEVSVYEVVYSTRYQSHSIAASGLLYVPKSTTDAFHLLSLQHGTIFLKSEAPSRCVGYAGGELWSSAGYIVLQGDYIGYGTSENFFHPYYDKTHAASATIDLVSASLDFLNSHNIPHSGKLFLSGYSEGGYVTMATLAALELENGTGLQLLAAAAGAGGYDLFALLSDFTQGSGAHVQPSYIVFLLMAYEKTYGWNKPLSHYFAPLYADLLPNLMSGNYNSTYINHCLTKDLSALFNQEFYQNLTGTGEMELKKALFINTLSDWAPSTPLRLYHGTEDDVIPFNNSEITFQKLESKGAKALQFLSIPGGNHATSKDPMMDSVLDWFKTF